MINLAIEKSRIIKCNEKVWKEYTKIMNNNHYQLKLLEFLNKAIPGLDKISAAARTKVSHWFKERIFMPRMKLIVEGKVSDCAYIIKKGTCALVSSKNPLARKQSGKVT